MGSAYGKGPNEVHIMQTGGCAQGGDCNFFATPVFDPGLQMDPKLQPHISPQEYKAVLDKARETVGAHGPRWQVWVSGIPLFILASVLAAFVRGETLQCTAANGSCGDLQTPAADQCCGYTCCPKEERRLRELNGSALALDFLAPPGAEEEEEAARSPPTARRTAAWACFQDEPSESAECRCVTEGSGKGEQEVCYGKVTIDGAHVVNPPVLWPIPVMILGFVAGGILCVAYPLYKQCALKGTVNPVFEPWRQKGLRVEYNPGNKYYRARIWVVVPEGPAKVPGTEVK